MPLGATEKAIYVSGRYGFSRARKNTIFIFQVEITAAEFVFVHLQWNVLLGDTVASVHG